MIRCQLWIILPSDEVKDLRLSPIGVAGLMSQLQELVGCITFCGISFLVHLFNPHKLDAVKKEMEAVRIAFKIIGENEPLPGYQEIPCHLIFTIKMEELQVWYSSSGSQSS